MMSTVAHPFPANRVVLRQHLRVLGAGARRAAPVVSVILIALLSSTLLRQPVNYGAEIGVWAGVMGFVAPALAWRALSGRGHLWTLPVPHRTHAMIVLAAGWIWLIAAVALLVGWMALTVVVSGGSFGAEETRLVLAPGISSSATVDPQSLRAVTWRRPTWVIGVPFVATTIAYLFGSALVLLTNGSRRWAAAMLLAVILVVSLAEPAMTGLSQLSLHPRGLETVLTGSPMRLKRLPVELSDGRTVLVWRALPSLAAWLSASAIWGAAGVAVVVLTARRRREH